jgi:hypothetical protein
VEVPLTSTITFPRVVTSPEPAQALNSAQRLNGWSRFSIVEQERLSPKK